MKNKIFYNTVFGLIAVVGLFLAIQNYKLREELHFCQQLEGHQGGVNIETERIKKIINENLLKDIGRSNTKLKMVIIYTPEDCPLCLDEVTHWAMLHETEESFSLWGLVNHPHNKLVQKYIRSMNWNFPNCLVPVSSYGENFGLEKTPLKILLNRENRIIYIEGALTNWQKEGKLEELITKML